MAERRETRQRQIVLETVRAHSDHPCADEIYMEARTMDPKISRGTVYRNLNLLSEDGEINHVRMPDSADCYDRRTDPHYHLRCISCGKVIDAPMEYQPESDLLMTEKTGFRILRHSTVFEGLCPACQQQFPDLTQKSPSRISQSGAASDEAASVEGRPEIRRH